MNETNNIQIDNIIKKLLDNLSVIIAITNLTAVFWMISPYPVLDTWYWNEMCYTPLYSSVYFANPDIFGGRWLLVCEGGTDGVRIEKKTIRAVVSGEELSRNVEHGWLQHETMYRS